MRRICFIWIVGIFLLLFVVPVSAQEIPDFNTDSLTMDSIAIDSLDPDPEWYVAPLVREADFAPRRAAAANCPVDSVLTFNVDSILSEVTVYEYGDTTRTMVWTVNADGSRVGKSRTESASTATTSYSATYAWDANTNNWKGTSKEEHTYNSANKETLRVLYNTWLNNAWVADTKYTWAYDAAGRESEYTTYTRNTTTNELVLSQQRIREWYNNSKLTLEIQYTAHNGSAWSAGTKKEYAYDASGNQIEYTYYSSLSNGNWVGSTHEKWTYTSGKKTYYEKQTWSNGTWVNDTKEVWEFNTAGKQTLHEKYNGSNTDWTLALQENSGYDAAGNNILIENYSLTNNVWTGTKKEEYTFNAANKQTLHEKYSWSNGDWSLTLQENSGYDDAGNNNLVENYNVSNGTFTGTKKEEYTFNSAKKKTLTIKYKWSNGVFVYNTKAVTDFDAAGNSIETANYTWTNNDWKGTGTRTLQTFNSSKKVTEKITQSWPTNATYWINKTCTTTVYSGANITQEEYYTWQNDAWLGTKRTDYHYNASNKNDTTTAYTFSDNEWKYANRTVNTFNANGTNIMTHNAKWQDNAWVMTSMTRMDISDMTVDGIRQTLNAQWQCGADSVWKGVQKDTSSYTSSGKKIMEAHYTSWANNAWVPSYIIEHEYDAADREILNRRMDWVNNKWQGHYLFEYEYDDQDRQIAYTYYGDWNNSTNSWIGSSKYDYVYGPNGKYSQQVMYKWQNNQWVGLFQYFYTYDASDREVEQLVQSYSNGNWENSQLYIHEYNGSQTLKNNEYRWRNGQWQYSRRNEKTYDKDIQAKLRREITGSWNTSGVAQSYSDKLYSYDCDPRTIRFVNYDGTLLETQIVEKGVTPSYSGVAPTREGNAEYTYTFAGWAPELVPVTNNATYTATYTATKNTYTITWVDDFGNEIDQTTAEYGTMPTHDNVSKANTAEFSYEFTGWTPGLGVVTGDAEYTATFKATKNSYTVTWLNSDNSLLSQSTVEYGVTPTSPSDPTKASTAEYSYTFTGWSPAITAVTGETTYTASFKETKNSYTITWQNSDNSPLATNTVEYGQMPAEPTTPTKQSTAEYSYTFSGWTPEIVSVTGNATYTATFEATKRKYTVTWLNEDGSIIGQEELEFGATPTHADINKESTAEFMYTFAGWTPGIGIVTGDAEYTATFSATKNSYYIIWLNDDNTEIDRTLVEYGIVPTHTAPTKEATDEHSYFFDKWTPDVVAVTGEATYKATYTETTKVYTITWLNEDGSEISHETLEYGATPSHVDPTKEATDEFSYTFAGWNPAVTSVTGDASYTATFTATKRSYTITWLNENGTEIDHTTVEYGVVPTHADATKENTLEYTYTFSCWTPQVVAVTGDATYTATFSSTANTYIITWKDENGVTLDQTTVTAGTLPAHADPVKQNTAEYTYAFTGWSPEVVAAVADATYQATFSATKNSYTITWLDDDNSIIEQKVVEYGNFPAHVDPVKQNSAEYTYSFTGWSPALASVTGEATYKATYTATKNSYTITFKNDDGSVLTSQAWEYGATPTCTPPTKQSTAEYTYTFAGWDKEIAPVTEATTYTATYNATKNIYTVTWLNSDNSLLSQSTVEYGVMPTSPSDPTKASTAEYSYTFTGWTPQITAVTGDAEYTATFTATKNKYLITFKDEDGSVLKSEELEYGVMPTAPSDPTKAATAEWTYTFAGWDKEIISVAEATTYTATYTATKNSYTITWLDDDNTQIDQTTVEYGVIPTHDDPTKQPTAQYGYTFAGWSPAISAVTGNATYKAMYTDTINQYTISWLDDIGTLVDQTKVAYGSTPAHANIYKESDDQYDYTFVGWTPTLVPVTGDASYSAIFTTAGKSYTVTFYFEDGVTILDQMTLPYGAIPSTPYIPSIPSDANHTYTFSGWSPEIAPVTGDISYVPTFTAIPNQYTVIFRNYNGKELQRKKVDYGTIPEYEGDEPSRPATNAYTWAFEGWTPELTAVIGDATYTAVYSKVMNTYTILFYDEDGTTLLDEVTVEHGQKPTTSVIPTKEADEEYTYTFAGWSPKIAKATMDATYTATYTATPKTQGLGDVQRDDVQCTKVLLDGTIYIRRGGNTYSIDGQRVK